MGLQNLNGWEMVVIILIGLFIFGPDRLPKVIQDGLRMLRQVRQMARNATNDLSRELGTTVDLEDLHPKTFIRKHLLSEEDERMLRKPFESAFSDLRGVTDSFTGAAESVTKEFKDLAESTSQLTGTSTRAAESPVQAAAGTVQLTKSGSGAAGTSSAPVSGGRPVYDDDAT